MTKVIECIRLLSYTTVVGWERWNDRTRIIYILINNIINSILFRASLITRATSRAVVTSGARSVERGWTRNARVPSRIISGAEGRRRRDEHANPRAPSDIWPHHALCTGLHLRIGHFSLPFLPDSLLSLLSNSIHLLRFIRVWMPTTTRTTNDATESTSCGN